MLRGWWKILTVGPGLNGWLGRTEGLRKNFMATRFIEEDAVVMQLRIRFGLRVVCFDERPQFRRRNFDQAEVCGGYHLCGAVGQGRELMPTNTVELEGEGAKFSDVYLKGGSAPAHAKLAALVLSRIKGRQLVNGYGVHG